MSNKKVLVGAALAGLAVGALSVSASANAEDVKCWGANACGAKSTDKTKAACGVKQEDIDAVKKSEFAKKFSKAKVHECGTHAECGASKGNLNWFHTSKDDCASLGGFLIVDNSVKKLPKVKK
ncbi:hypothetical protein [Fluviispira vulneris]|uniref:hypothetical protein n=1 Tax=Fluviispira vulneris TaxID=2763012 RepID=UPI001648CB7B|nr:hypothetical protein [Fluviispira vulneris]